MSNAERNVSQRQQVRNITERVSDLEAFLQGDLAKVVQAIDDSLSAQRKAGNDLATVVAAVVEILGMDQVDAKIREISDRRAAEAAETAQKALYDALANGTVENEDVVSETSLIVGTEKDASGAPVGQGRVQLTYERIAPEYQRELLGKGVGTTFATSNGGTFEVTGVYRILSSNTNTEASAPEQAE